MRDESERNRSILPGYGVIEFPSENSLHGERFYTECERERERERLRGKGAANGIFRQKLLLPNPSSSVNVTYNPGRVFSHFPFNPGE